MHINTNWYTNAIAANPEASEFLISTAEELAGLAAIVNEAAEGIGRDSFEGKTIRLAADIDLSPYENWVPIGIYDHHSLNRYKWFAGIFDGCNHSVSNLTINRPNEEGQGLFGHIESGLVKNLGLHDVNICGSIQTGGIVGLITKSGRADNCYSTGNVSGSILIGGVAGQIGSNSSMTRCRSSCTVSGNNSIGGIAGGIARKCNLKSCCSTGTVSCAGTAKDESAGGITGYVSAGSTVVNCIALNPAVISASPTVGRVVGDISDSDEYGGIQLSNNTALATMKNSAGNADWADKGADRKDGEDVAGAMKK